MLENRARYVQALLTILKGYQAAGSPRQPVRAFGRFEEWSATIRSAIVWAGLADPCKTRERVVAENPERARTVAVYQLWHALLGEDPVQLARVIARAENNEQLKNALLEVAAVYNNPKQIDPKVLGNWCRDRKDRIVEGLVLVQGPANKSTKTGTWCIVKTSSEKRFSYKVGETLDGLGKPKPLNPAEEVGTRTSLPVMAATLTAMMMTTKNFEKTKKE